MAIAYNIWIRTGLSDSENQSYSHRKFFIATFSTTRGSCGPIDEVEVAHSSGPEGLASKLVGAHVRLLREDPSLFDKEGKSIFVTNARIGYYNTLTRTYEGPPQPHEFEEFCKMFSKELDSQRYKEFCDRYAKALEEEKMKEERTS